MLVADLGNGCQRRQHRQPTKAHIKCTQKGQLVRRWFTAAIIKEVGTRDNDVYTSTSLSLSVTYRSHRTKSSLRIPSVGVENMFELLTIPSVGDAEPEHEVAED